MMFFHCKLMVTIHFIACSAVVFLIIYVNILAQLALLVSGQIFCYKEASGKQGLIN